MEFQRQGGGVISGSVRTFDLVIRLKNNPQARARGRAGCAGEPPHPPLHLSPAARRTLARPPT
jgi:hypothetical protein